jgi:LPS biosynthesis protein
MLHRFVNKVHLILDKLRITHFLCYNALWGQIRYKRMFPWQREIEMCIVRKSEHSLAGLEEIFQVSRTPRYCFRLTTYVILFTGELYVGSLMYKE